MRIATFNVNGLKARAPIVLDWLSKEGPDVALLQEIKSTDEALPRELFEEAGYAVEAHGQKGFNGVAIASKLALEDVSRGLPGDDADEQARWIEATVVGVQAVRLCCLYLPNGNPAPGPKYDYKLGWMERLRERAEALLAAEEVAIMAGDYNVIPQAEDAARPEVMREDALFLPETRAAWRRIVNAGWTDALRVRACRGPGTTPTGTIRPAPTIGTTGSGSTTLCSARAARISCAGPGSSATCGRGRGRPTTRRYGSSSTPEGPGSVSPRVSSWSWIQAVRRVTRPGASTDPRRSAACAASALAPPRW